MRQRSQARVRHTLKQALRQWQHSLENVPAFIRDDVEGLNGTEIQGLIDEIEISRISLRKRSTREHS